MWVWVWVGMGVEHCCKALLARLFTHGAGASRIGHTPNPMWGGVNVSKRGVSMHQKGVSMYHHSLERIRFLG